ncbi:hypothetical protein SUDANB105_01539 [Streptomyces sp. enrichment culture]|uniref:hypothetical protein n=1 Tax=Streptomyces sp. enrichment culture TaxID=1795815 RepID=UPI003F57293F
MGALPKVATAERQRDGSSSSHFAELTGDERIAATTYGKAQHGALPAIKRSLTTYRLASADREPEPADVLAARLRQAWKLWHARDRRSGPGHTVEGNRSRIAALLPGLLADTQHATRSLEGADRRRALVALAETYHLAQLFLSSSPPRSW